ncbi:MAG: DUF1579 domain-containing protein [Planctomycetota bacterium]|nr:MAG: DUF1579 domain-containing protein [Planctomycetota bacterium]
MKLQFVSIALLTSLAACGSAPAESKNSSVAVSDAAMQEPTFEPSPEHAIIMRTAGTWDVVVDAQGQKSKAVQVMKSVGGFWVAGTWDGEMMGAPFQGHMISGYDPTLKVFTGVWVDSMSPALFHSAGTWDAATNTMHATIRGTVAGQEMVMKEVTTHPDDNHYKTTMSMVGADGVEMTVMVFDATRRK